MTPEPSIGHWRVLRIVATRYGGARHHYNVVQLRPDSALCSGLPSGFNREGGSLSDVVGSHPEYETDHWTSFYPEALVTR